MSLSPSEPHRRSNRLNRKGTIETLPSQYRPLHNRQIRILHLAPGQKGDPLVGEMHIGDLDDDDIEYDALSYMWGDPTHVGEIRIEDQTFQVGHNLNAALQSLRYPDKTLIIWIDAICINQVDLDEKARQVPLMRWLYSRARIVRTFVNVTVDTTCDAFKELQTFRTSRSIQERYGPDSDPDFWDPVYPLLANPYWARVWIQQEVLFSRAWVIHCDNASVEFLDIVAFCNTGVRVFNAYASADPSLFSKGREHTKKFLKNKALELVIKKHRQMDNIDWKKPLYQTLIDSCRLETTDPRDKLYACMHLASDFVEGSIKVDYRKDPREVFLDAAEYHVRHNKNVEFLIEINSKSAFACTNLPSWFPMRWTDPTELRYPLISPDTFHCPSPLWGQHQSDMMLDLSSGRLAVRGLHIDGVRRCLTSDLSIDSVLDDLFWDLELGLYLLHTPSAQGTILSLLARYLDVAQDTLAKDLSATVSAYEHLRRLTHGEDVTCLLFEALPEINPSWADIMHSMSIYDIVELESGNLAVVTKNSCKTGDEVWIVLGCSLGIALSPQSDGVYTYCSPVVAPTWENYEAFKYLTEFSKAGNMIEDFVVKDSQIT